MDHPGVEHLASLARLRLEPAEAAALGRDLERMLRFFRSLAQVDTAGVEPSPYPLELPDVLDPDEPRPGLTQGEALGNAPAAAEGCFLVPPVLGEG